jgi:hypothetical protein
MMSITNFLRYVLLLLVAAFLYWVIIFLFGGSGCNFFNCTKKASIAQTYSSGQISHDKAILLDGQHIEFCSLKDGKCLYRSYGKEYDFELIDDVQIDILGDGDPERMLVLKNNFLEGISWYQLQGVRSNNYHFIVGMVMSSGTYSGLAKLKDTPGFSVVLDWDSPKKTTRAVNLYPTDNSLFNFVKRTFLIK